MSIGNAEGRSKIEHREHRNIKAVVVAVTSNASRPPKAVAVVGPWIERFTHVRRIGSGGVRQKCQSDR